MTTLKDTAYPHFKPKISASELERNYSPTEAELTFIQGLVSGPAPQTATMIHLKMLQVMGRILKLPEVPQLVRDHIARCLALARSPTLKELGRFERGGNRAVKIKKLREFLDVRPLDEKGFAWLKHVAEEAAEVKHSVADIINVMLEELVRHRHELPAFSTLDRAAYAAREQSNEQYFNSITSKLGPQTKVMIDGLLKVFPRQNSCRPDRNDNPGAAMKDESGKVRTGIQGQSGGAVAAAGELGSSRCLRFGIDLVQPREASAP